MKNNTNKQLDKGFWRECSQPVPGRPTLKTNSKTRTCQNFKSTSFKEFQESVDDAWDLQDDEFYKNKVQRTVKADISPVHNVGCASRKPFNKGIEIDCGKMKIECEQSSSGKLVQTNVPENLVNKFDISKRNYSKSSVLKVSKFQSLLESPLMNLDDLRLLSWSGVPPEVRPEVWRLLAGYLPTSEERRERTLERKRLEYWGLVKQYFYSSRDEAQEKTYRQIHIDIPRMSPMSEIFQQKSVQVMFERILYTWAVRHPASGYVQGMNDLVTPFFFVFLREFLPPDCDPDLANIDLLPKEDSSSLEADSFWCFSKFLEGIQDNFIFAQLGIQLKVNQLKELIQRIDKDFHKHLENNEINYLQFSFRWMNNLLTREIPLRCSFRLWDTYLAELDNFPTFQLYVSAAFLLHWKDKLLKEQDFQGLIIFLHNPPTQKWTDVDVGMLLADAHRLMFMFADSPNHLQNIQS